MEEPLRILSRGVLLSELYFLKMILAAGRKDYEVGKDGYRNLADQVRNNHVLH